MIKNIGWTLGNKLCQEYELNYDGQENPSIR